MDMRSGNKVGLSVEEAAEAAGIGRGQIFVELREGRLVGRKVGRRTIIPVSELEAWLSARPRACGVRGAAA